MYQCSKKGKTLSAIGTCRIPAFVFECSIKNHFSSKFIFSFFKSSSSLTRHLLRPEDHHDDHDGAEDEHPVFGKGAQVFRREDEDDRRDDDARDGTHAAEHHHVEVLV